MKGIIQEETVPVQCRQQRQFSRLDSVRTAIKIKIAVAAAAIVHYLKDQLLGRIELHHSHKSGLIDGHIIVEVTELHQSHRIDIGFISSQRHELLTGYEAEFLRGLPGDIGILDRRRKVIHRIWICVFIE